MKNRRIINSLALLVVLSLLLVGCGSFSDSQASSGSSTAGEKEAQAVEKVLKLSFNNDIPDLNQTTTTDTISFTILNNVAEGLYRLDEENKPQPAMAKGVEVSEDGLTYTFTLRDDIKWSNGEPVTSQDFKYGWLRGLNPETSGSYSFIIADYVVGAQEFVDGTGKAEDVKIETPDDKTFVVQIKQPTPYFVSLTAFPLYFPLNEKFINEKGESYALSADGLVYNGPFMLAEFDPAKGVVMVKNPNYWDKDNLKVDKLDIKVIKEQGTALNLYQAGDLDMAPLSSSDVNSFKDTPEFRAYTNFRSYYIQFNLHNEAIGNKNIRKAIQLAVDPDVLTKNVLNNGSETATGLIPTGMAGSGVTFREAQGDLILPNIEKAKELWAKGLGELGKAPQLELLTADDQVSKDCGTFIQSQLKKNLDIDITLVTQPYSGRLQTMRDDKYQMVVSAWGADYNDPMTYLDLWAAPAKPFRGNFSNERYDQLITGAKAEVDSAKRMDMLLEAERILMDEEAILAPLYYQGNAFACKEHVEGLVYHPYGVTWDFKWAAVK
ncbi:MAG: ABC transporter substrate-binding protein [Clostridia bacterium BRH_c25]|nr:MAG: ABC transporter substrate-binding protein [Clostridia bacterium BRH_c25]